MRCGTRVLELAKGKVAVEVGGEKDLMLTLKRIKTAVLNGELDTQIDAAANKLRNVFDMKIFPIEKILLPTEPDKVFQLKKQIGIGPAQLKFVYKQSNLILVKLKLATHHIEAMNLVSRTK